MTANQQKCVEDNLGLIYIVLKGLNIGRENPEFEDYYSIGTIGLCKASIQYIKNDKLRFSTYAYKMIRFEILMELRRRKRAILCSSSTDLIDVVDQESTEKNKLVEERICLTQVLEKNKELFTPFQIRILKMMSKGVSIKNIALSNKKPVSYVSLQKRLAIKLLKEIIEDKE